MQSKTAREVAKLLLKYSRDTVRIIIFFCPIIQIWRLEKFFHIHIFDVDQ